MSTVIIDYGSGNLHSAAKSFERAARDAGIATQVKVSAKPEDLRQAERIVLPGVGAFRDCWDGLNAVPGMVETLKDEVMTRGKPFLGICVGMQLMAGRGLEHGETPGLGWIGGDVVRLTPADPALKIPHMGWNTLMAQRPNHLLAGLQLGPLGLHAYFVHSYHLAAHNPADVLALAGYGGPVTAMVLKGNLLGTQFHPEKSQELGLRLIASFLRWTP